MDYASDIDSYGLPIRKRKRGGMSFLVIATGTIFLAAAWIMAASNPYTELAHRVVEVKPETPAAASDGRVPLFELAIDEAERSDDPGTALVAPGSTSGDGNDEPSGVDALRPGTIIEIGGVAYGPVRGPDVRDGYGKAYGDVHGPVRPGAADLTVAIGLLPDDDDLIGPRMPAGMAFEHGLDDEVRHAVQRRLGLAGHDAGAPDGIFGPKTREALVAYQAEAGLEESGFADAATVAALENATETKYTAWVQSELKAAKKAQARRAASRRASSVDAAPVPQAREIPVAPGKCRRRADGTIVGRQSLGCDIKGLGSAIGRLFGGEGGGGARADAGFVNAAPDR